MKKYHYLYIIIIIGIFLTFGFTLYENINNTIHQYTPLVPKKYAVTPSKVITNKNTTPKSDKAIMIVKDETTYYEPESFLLESKYNKLYNFIISDFTSAELYRIKNAHIIFEPSDLIGRKSNYSLKSILYEKDIQDISQIVHFLRSKENNVGAYMTIASLEKEREDVNLLDLKPNVDYSTIYKRILMNGDEYLPIGEPTPQYEAFMQYRLSQVKRCGFNFVQLGVIDPISIINYKNTSFDVNPTINLNAFRNFIYRILQYCSDIKLKVCISDFPAIFNNHEQDLAAQIHYVNVFSTDARSFINPSLPYKEYFSTLPVFLSTILRNNAIENFINITDWPENSVLFEMSTVGIHPPIPNVPIKPIPQIKWCPYPKRWWKIVIPELPPIKMIIPNISDKLPLYPHITVKQQTTSVALL
jgi:hypothetical protein